ncbi:hypothetical protein BJ973_004086 [Actinoplanes tereljensis]|uniref:hypothetical protein n=1 Tax=Paractinoplanes tereljensis TaxID=571912 RepID=UPI001942A8E9|nr:hypothetical protein [Actinoplanes tereljensis]
MAAQPVGELQQRAGDGESAVHRVPGGLSPAADGLPLTGFAQRRAGLPDIWS